MRQTGTRRGVQMNRLDTCGISFGPGGGSPMGWEGGDGGSRVGSGIVSGGSCGDGGVLGVNGGSGGCGVWALIRLRCKASSGSRSNMSAPWFFVVDAGSSTPRGWHATRRHVSQPSSPAMHMPSVCPPDYGRLVRAPKEKRPSKPDIFRYRSRGAFRMTMTKAATATIFSRQYPPCQFRSLPHPMP